MTPPERIEAAVAAGVLTATRGWQPLLQSIVTVARATFGAQAASIMLHDAEAGELVFEAVSGAGEGTLVGERFAAHRGIAGFVLSARQPMVVDDVAQDPRHAADIAQRSGYEPATLMAAPLLDDEQVLGVLNVLDRRRGERSSIVELELLGLLAGQAALAVRLLLTVRRAAAVRDDPGLAAVARVAGRLDELEGERREAGARLLSALDDVLTPPADTAAL